MAAHHGPCAWLADVGDVALVVALLADLRDWFERDLPSSDALRAGVERLLVDPDSEYQNVP